MTPVKKESWLQRNVDPVMRYIIVAMLTFVINGIVHMSNDVIEIKVRLATTQQQVNDKNVTIDELKGDIKASREAMTQVEERIAALEAKQTK